MDADKILATLIQKLVTYKSNNAESSFDTECKQLFKDYLNSLSKYYDDNSENLNPSKQDFMQQHLREHGKSWIDTPLECILAIKKKYDLFINFNDACKEYGFSLNFDAKDPKTQDTVFHYASGMWDLNFIMNIIVESNDIRRAANTQNIAGFTPAHYAFLSSTLSPEERSRRLKVLESIEADLTRKSNNGYTPLDIPPQTEFNNESFNCLHISKFIYTDQKQDFLKSLGKNAKDHLNSKSLFNKSPIIYIAYSGKIEVVEMIGEYGGSESFNSTDNGGFTPLHYAMTYHPTNLDLIKALIKGGAKYDIPSNNKPSAYDFAKQHDLKPIVEYFDQLKVEQMLEQPKAITITQKPTATTLTKPSSPTTTATPRI